MNLSSTLMVVSGLFILAACNKKPEASFSTDKSEPKTGEVIQFINTSKNAYTAHWEFGDGTVSGLMNPSKSYEEEGIYPVTLTVYSKSGRRSESITQNITVGDAEFFLDVKVDGRTVKLYPSENSDLMVTHLNEKNINPGSTCFGIYSSVLNDGTENLFMLSKGVLSWYNDSIAPDDDFTSFFQVGSIDYAQVGGHGVGITYYEDGEEYSTNLFGGNQTGSTFTITSTATELNTWFEVAVECTFTCRIYNKHGTYKTMTGKYRGTFRNS